MTNTSKHLTGLLDQWVTVKHPDAPHRVWQGRLVEFWDQWSIVLETHGGGRETFPAAFDVSPTTEPAPGPAGAPRPWTDLRTSGLLWLINRTAFHPRGLALAVHTDRHGRFTGWSLMSNDDREPWQFDPATDSDGYERAEATLAAALAPPARLLDCGLCYEEHGEEVHPHPECPKSAGPAVVDARTHLVREQLVEGSRYPAGAPCCVCHGGPVVYDNYKGQLFCWRCADCDCGRDGPCIRTGLHRREDVWSCTATGMDAFHGRARCEAHATDATGLVHAGTSQDGSWLSWRDGDKDSTPDTSPDTDPDSTNTVRTTDGPDTDTPALTSADTVRTTCPDSSPDMSADTGPDSVRTECPDNDGQRPGGFRFDYRARVPRRQMGAAFLEAFGLLAAAQDAAQEPPRPEDDDRLGKPEHAHARLGLAREVLVDDGYFTDDEVGPDLAPRLVEWLVHHRGKADQAQREVMALRDRVGELADALAEAIGYFTIKADSGHGVRTGFVDQRTVDQWRLVHTGKSLPCWTFPHVEGICPTCRRPGLFLGSGGCVTCSHEDCRRPDAATTVLEDPPSAAHTCNRPDCLDLIIRTVEAERRAHLAYEWLRTDVITAVSFIRQQKRVGPLSPLRCTRSRLLATLPTWIKDPGPLTPVVAP